MNRDHRPPRLRPAAARARGRPKWDHWRWMRNDHLATDDGLGQLGRVFPPIAAAAANRIGLLHPRARAP